MSDISVIIMRDRGRSHSFRFSPTTFKIALSLLIIVPVLLIASIWFGLSSYSKYITVLEETAGLKQAIEHNKQTVTRLANLERFLQKYSPDMLGLLVPTEDVDSFNLPVIDGDKGVFMGELADSLTGAQMSFDIIENAGQKKSSEKEGADKTSSESAEEDAAQVQEQPAESVKAAETEKAEEKSESDVSAIAENTQETGKEAAQEQTAEGKAQELSAAAQESSITQKVDLGYIEIGNFHARLYSQSIDIRYQLMNVGKKAQIEGRQKYYLSSQIDGKFALQELSGTTDSTFRIRNLKNVQSTASIAGMKIGDKAQIVVDIVMDNQVVFRQLYPLTR